VKQAEDQIVATGMKKQIDELFAQAKDVNTPDKASQAALVSLRELVPKYLSAQVNLAEDTLKQEKVASPKIRQDKFNTVKQEGVGLDRQIADLQTQLDALLGEKDVRSGIDADVSLATNAFSSRNYSANKVVSDSQLAMAKRQAAGEDISDAEKVAASQKLITQNQSLLASIQTYIDDLNAAVKKAADDVDARKATLTKDTTAGITGGKLTADQTALNEAVKNEATQREKVTAEETKQFALLGKQVELQKAAAPTTIGGAVSSGFGDWKGANSSTVFQDIRTGVPQVMNSTTTAMSSFVTSMEAGTTKVGMGFKNMAVSILQSMQSVVTNALMKQFMGMAINMGMSAFGGAGGAGAGMTGASNMADTPVLAGATRATWQGGDILSRWAGGSVPRRSYALGGDTPTSTRDSQNILAAPGEFIMRQSAVDLIGADTLSGLNAMGNSYNSGAGKSVSNAANANKPREPDTVHVYVMAPDAKPSLGPKDILSVIGDDIMRGGQTKQLIKSVQMGQ
jgi:hypothetical protein